MPEREGTGHMQLLRLNSEEKTQLSLKDKGQELATKDYCGHLLRYTHVHLMFQGHTGK